MSAQRLMDTSLRVEAIEDGHCTVTLLPMSIRRLLHDVVKLQGRTASLARVKLSYRISDGMPRVVLGDFPRLMQALSILASHAVKAAPKDGSGRVVIEAAWSAFPTSQFTRVKQQEEEQKQQEQRRRQELLDQHVAALHHVAIEDQHMDCGGGRRPRWFTSTSSGIHGSSSSRTSTSSDGTANAWMTAPASAPGTATNPVTRGLSTSRAPSPCNNNGGSLAQLHQSQQAVASQSSPSPSGFTSAASGCPAMAVKLAGLVEAVDVTPSSAASASRSPGFLAGLAASALASVVSAAQAQVGRLSRSNTAAAVQPQTPASSHGETGSHSRDLGADSRRSRSSADSVAAASRSSAASDISVDVPTGGAAETFYPSFMASITPRDSSNAAYAAAASSSVASTPGAHSSAGEAAGSRSGGSSSSSMPYYSPYNRRLIGGGAGFALGSLSIGAGSGGIASVVHAAAQMVQQGLPNADTPDEVSSRGPLTASAPLPFPLPPPLPSNISAALSNSTLSAASTSVSVNTGPHNEAYGLETVMEGSGGSENQSGRDDHSGGSQTRSDRSGQQPSGNRSTTGSDAGAKSEANSEGGSPCFPPAASSSTADTDAAVMGRTPIAPNTAYQEQAMHRTDASARLATTNATPSARAATKQPYDAAQQRQQQQLQHKLPGTVQQHEEHRTLQPAKSFVPQITGLRVATAAIEQAAQTKLATVMLGTPTRASNGVDSLPQSVASVVTLTPQSARLMMMPVVTAGSARTPAAAAAHVHASVPTPPSSARSIGRLNHVMVVAAQDQKVAMAAARRELTCPASSAAAQPAANAIRPQSGAVGAATPVTWAAAHAHHQTVTARAPSRTVASAAEPADPRITFAAAGGANLPSAQADEDVDAAHDANQQDQVEIGVHDACPDPVTPSPTESTARLAAGARVIALIVAAPIALLATVASSVWRAVRPSRPPAQQRVVENPTSMPLPVSTASPAPVQPCASCTASPIEPVVACDASQNAAGSPSAAVITAAAGEDASPVPAAEMTQAARRSRSASSGSSRSQRRNAAVAALPFEPPPRTHYELALGEDRKYEVTDVSVYITLRISDNLPGRGAQDQERMFRTSRRARSPVTAAALREHSTAAIAATTAATEASASGPVSASRPLTVQADDNSTNRHSGHQPFSLRVDRGFDFGLHLVHETVASHGGTVTVESLENHGSTYHVTMPMRILRLTEVTLANARAPSPSGYRRGSGAGPSGSGPGSSSGPGTARPSGRSSSTGKLNKQSSLGDGNGGTGGAGGAASDGLNDVSRHRSQSPQPGTGGGGGGGGMSSSAAVYTSSGVAGINNHSPGAVKSSARGSGGAASGPSSGVIGAQRDPVHRVGASNFLLLSAAGTGLVPTHTHEASPISTASSVPAASPQTSGQTPRSEAAPQGSASHHHHAHPLPVMMTAPLHNKHGFSLNAAVKALQPSDQLGQVSASTGYREAANEQSEYAPSARDQPKQEAQQTPAISPRSRGPAPLSGHAINVYDRNARASGSSSEGVHAQIYPSYPSHNAFDCENNLQLYRHGLALAREGQAHELGIQQYCGVTPVWPATASTSTASPVPMPGCVQLSGSTGSTDDTTSPTSSSAPSAPASTGIPSETGSFLTTTSGSASVMTVARRNHMASASTPESLESNDRGKHPQAGTPRPRRQIKQLTRRVTSPASPAGVAADQPQLSPASIIGTLTSPPASASHPPPSRGPAAASHHDQPESTPVMEWRR